MCGCSIATVRRRKSALFEHGAVLTKDGWHIPMEALLATGLLDRVTVPETGTKPRNLQEVPVPERELVRLRAALVAAEHRAELAEVKQRAAEDQAETQAALNADLRQAWQDARAQLAITQMPHSVPIPMPTGPSAEPVPVRPRHWWSRRS